ncbi:Methyltransferase domain-containing protein [Streptomyces sp. BpilaLS-43]|uniref:class I SAM-dependent methyltransferase n=1 Tax=Streptomyces sp. BpilaLS-43 TaxID=1839778 RepID=UPI00081B8416|nr:class I SAM-dependent methyltransferase [Streptomyces sp. BpilaLS-43]SCD77395.1 Methyltransferase domain-containing protein [Streptomyces sp. BpilaLS-43]
MAHSTSTHVHTPRPGTADGGAQDPLAQMLDLDAVVFGPYLATVTDRLARLAGDGVTRIVDLGAGTGTGTFALLERFPAARVTAVDSSPDMLARLAGTARLRGLAERVHTLHADADEALTGLVDTDLVWASASLHHLEDHAGALAAIRAALRPGGLLAVAEMDGVPRFLPHDAVPARPGLEDRLRTALDELHAGAVPHLGADWGARLTEAGFTVEREQATDLELRAPLPEGAGRYAHLTLARVRGALDGRIDPADLAALDLLLDGGPLDVRHREDLLVRSGRELWLARRPVDGP